MIHRCYGVSVTFSAAPSGHGKSTCALSIAYYNAIQGKVVRLLWGS